ncbi:MAG: T9SS type A sorting domain-containing protein [Bacteroidota bacterium]
MKNNSLRLLCASVMMAMASNAGAQGVITTVAGTGTAGFSGDGGLASAARLSTPAGVATDADGNIYIADKSNHRVRMISASTGMISTYAGTGAYGYSGMGGAATAAAIEYPNAIYCDNSGNVFVSDHFADVGYRIDGATHMIANICGNGTQGCSGDGGGGCFARMCVPDGIYGDNSGNIYLLDVGNHRIRKVDAGTGIVNTFAGTFAGPYANGTHISVTSFGTMNGICSDIHGNLYIADGGNHCVRKVDALTGNVRTIAGTPGVAGNTGDGGSATVARLNMPKALFVNNDGYLFICDPNSNVVRVVNLNTGIINTLAGNGSMGFSGDGGSPLTAKLAMPTGVWEDAAGNIYIADAGNHRVRKITGSGYKFATASGTVSTEATIFPNPSNGSFTVVTPGNATLEVFNIAGVKVYADYLAASQTTVTLNQPSGVYTVKVNSASGTTVEKITIAR